MFMSSLWKILSVLNAVKWQHRDAQDARTNGIAQGTAKLDNGKVTSHYVIFYSAISKKTKTEMKNSKINRRNKHRKSQ